MRKHWEWEIVAQFWDTTAQIVTITNFTLQSITTIKNECFERASLTKKWINDWFWVWLQKQIGTNSITATTSSCTLTQIKKVWIINILALELAK